MSTRSRGEEHSKGACWERVVGLNMIDSDLGSPYNERAYSDAMAGLLALAVVSVAALGAQKGIDGRCARRTGRWCKATILSLNLPYGHRPRSLL